MSYLLNRGADVNARAANFNTPLGVAIETKPKEAAKFLCMHGAVVSEKDVEGLKDLGLASRFGVIDREIARYWSSLTKGQQDKRLPPKLVAQLS